MPWRQDLSTFVHFNCPALATDSNTNVRFVLFLWRCFGYQICCIGLDQTRHVWNLYDLWTWYVTHYFIIWQGVHGQGKSQGNSSLTKSQRILKWVREVLKFMESQEKVRELNIFHCEPWKFESKDWIKWNPHFRISNWRRLISWFVFIIHD